MFRTVALVAAGMPFCAGSAMAAEVRVTGADTVTYVAAPGEANVVDISSPAGDPQSIRIADRGATIIAGDGCRSAGPGVVTCSPPPAPKVPPRDELPPYMSLDAVRISTGDLDDEITSREPSLVADGGLDRAGRVTTPCAVAAGSTATHADRGGTPWPVPSGGSSSRPVASGFATSTSAAIGRSS